MNVMTIDSLNKEYAIQNQLSFFENENNKNFPFIRINNKYANAVISIYGGQVLSFQPINDTDILFVSKKAYYQHGKAIKGGIPVCWPWFGNDPEGLGRAAHGFARNRIWSVTETKTTDNEETQVSLGLVDSEETRAIWPYSFNLTLKITVGKTLKLELITQNTGKEKFTITQALHTYFVVGDIKKTRVDGLDGIEYIDTTFSDWPVHKQKDAVTIDKEVDRIYTNVPNKLTLIDKSLKRQTRITSSGSNSTVVWNPWAKIAEEMADLQDHDYLNFLCVETTNAASDKVKIQPGKEFCLTAEYKTIKE